LPSPLSLRTIAKGDLKGGVFYPQLSYLLVNEGFLALTYLIKFLIYEEGDLAVISSCLWNCSRR
jgi:hypothetical protein